jgi:hypothetical protein
MENKNNKKASDFIEFYMGILLIIAGLFFLLSKAVVHSGFYGWSVAGGINVSTGLVVIPLMIGIIWLVNNPKSILAKLITIAGSIFIVGSIIINIRITFTTTSMFDYLIMMLLIAGGIGLLLKSIFMARK